MRLGITVAWLAIVAAIAMTAQSPLQPLTRAERTGFEETSRYEDVRTFINELTAKSNVVRMESFGKSEEGRDLPLLVIDPKSASTRRPIVFVMANIHAGEVEGKEAVLQFARRLVIGDLQSLTRNVVWLLAPIYNADGNERISLDNRSEQNGPLGGVGTRENAGGLDLNRDFIKLESVEARSLVGLMRRWNPDVIVDLHTTNGSYHGYQLTYSPPLNPNTDPRLIAFLGQRLLPAVTKALSTKHGVRTFYYGNFSIAESLERELELPDAKAGTPVWRTFDHRPRFGNNYVGLRNRLAILSEAYSYLDFKGRVRATEAFIEEIGRFVNEHASDIRSLISQVDDDVVRGAAAASDAGIAFNIRPLPERADILVGAVEQKSNPRSGKAMTATVESAVRPMRMSHYGVFAATAKRRVPDEYLIPPSETGVDQVVAKKLSEHGIRVETLTAPATLNVERFIIDAVHRSERPFQGHHEIAVNGRFERARVSVPAGTLVVRTRQPLGRLAFYLLEPESDDGLQTWNYLDAALEPGAAHPILKTVPGQTLPARNSSVP